MSELSRSRTGTGIRIAASIFEEAQSRINEKNKKIEELSLTIQDLECRCSELLEATKRVSDLKTLDTDMAKMKTTEEPVSQDSLCQDDSKSDKVFISPEMFAKNSRDLVQILMRGKRRIALDEIIPYLDSHFIFTRKPGCSRSNAVALIRHIGRYEKTGRKSTYIFD